MRAIDEMFRRRLAKGQGNRIDRVGIGITTRLARHAYMSTRFNPSPHSPNTVISRLIKPGAVFFDGGANIGQMSRIASVIAGPSGEVHAFEPHPTIFRQLENCMRSGGFDNVHCNNVALSSQAGEVTLFTAENNVSSSLSQDYLHAGNLAQAGAVKVMSITLDEYYAAMKRPVDLIKLDLEGHEFEALKGAERIIDEARPVIICEASANGAVHEFIEFMLARAYIAHTIDSQPMDIMTPSDYKPGIHLDIVFAHPLSRLYDGAGKSPLL